MRQQVTQYVFNPAARTITFLPPCDGLSLVNITFITNISASNTSIYQFNNSVLGGTMSGSVLTLTFNTTGMSATDQLQIYADLPVKPSANGSDPTLKDLLAEVRQIRNIVEQHTGLTSFE